MGSSDDRVVAVIMVGGPTKGCFEANQRFGWDWDSLKTSFFERRRRVFVAFPWVSFEEKSLGLFMGGIFMEFHFLATLCFLWLLCTKEAFGGLWWLWVCFIVWVEFIEINMEWKWKCKKPIKWKLHGMEDGMRFDGNVYAWKAWE